MNNSPPAVFFCVNRHLNTAELLCGFRYWEEVQGAFRCGILMSDGHSATGIGRVGSLKEFESRAEFGETTVLEDSGAGCEECSRSFGPHYSGACQHGGGQ